RLRAAGYRGPDLFTKGAIQLISKASEGLTRRINILADKALLAAFAMAFSPWTVAWAREARFYTMQQTCYLLFVWAFWKGIQGTENQPQQSAASSVPIAAAALGAYLAGLMVSLHSLLFLCVSGLFSAVMAAGERRLRSRWTVLAVATGLLAAGTLVFYRLTLPAHDASVVFSAASSNAHVYDPAQGRPMYYVGWLWDNLGSGFFLLAAAGTLLMIAREGRRGVYMALAFWGPLLVLSLALAYRRHRFLFFAFPFYTAAFSYAIAVAAPWIFRARCGSPGRKIAAAAAFLFIARVAWSGMLLAGDSLEAARGADTTLATRHPQFRTPCLYVRERLTPDTVVVADTYVSALYYIGRVDEWFPSARLPSERWEIGTEGLKTLDDLKAFVARHPKGYFIAEWYRFGFFPEQEADRAWVNEHMVRIEEASTGDVTLYAWGIPQP
ncbi:MAG TPA: DUF2723 domain-containing protein, partial [Candidatus Hydrogenedentes bacterium]|nr:DUF2723 domain-containing protein [Candidatus Hydrogenedentota bacterium]